VTSALDAPHQELHRAAIDFARTQLGTAAQEACHRRAASTTRRVVEDDVGLLLATPEMDAASAVNPGTTV
jgi:hypothetical protein